MRDKPYREDRENLPLSLWENAHCMYHILVHFTKLNVFTRKIYHVLHRQHYCTRTILIIIQILINRFLIFKRCKFQVGSYSYDDTKMIFLESGRVKGYVETSRSIVLDYDVKINPLSPKVTNI